MKKLLSVLFILVFVFSLTACKSVKNSGTNNAVTDPDLVKIDVNGDVTYDIPEYYYNKYKELVGKYGKADFKDGKLQGVAVVRLLNFVGTDSVQLYVAYADGTTDYVNKQMVVGFNNGPAYLLDNEKTSVSTDITSKATADATTPSIWLYNDVEGKGYIVTGDDMSNEPVYNGYITVSRGENYYTFQPVSGVLDGEIEKIDLAGLDEEAFNAINAKNREVISRLESLLYPDGATADEG